MSGPTIDRANSSGDIWTPDAFIDQVTINFGMLAVDLAAEAHNKKAPEYIGPEVDSLKQEWARILDGRLGWLNPPYTHITPWARKCMVESHRPDSEVVRAGAEILLLVPGSVGANWYWDYVEPYADVYSIGRLKFDNCFDRKTGLPVKTAYPKDLILCHYYNRQMYKEMQRWRWKGGN